MKDFFHATIGEAHTDAGMDAKTFDPMFKLYYHRPVMINENVEWVPKTRIKGTVLGIILVLEISDVKTAIQRAAIIVRDERVNCFEIKRSVPRTSSTLLDTPMIETKLVSTCRGAQLFIGI